jgi:hypothetical protein
MSKYYGLPYYPQGKRRPVYNQITIDRDLVRVGGKRVDSWFANYTLGNLPPNYPVPSTLLRCYEEMVSPASWYWTPYDSEAGVYCYG